MTVHTELKDYWRIAAFYRKQPEKERLAFLQSTFLVMLGGVKASKSRDALVRMHNDELSKLGKCA